MTGAKKSKNVHYVDNKKFLSAMIEFKELYHIEEKNEEIYEELLADMDIDSNSIH